MAAIEVRDVYKSFRIPHEHHTTLTERLLSLFQRVSYERLEAVQGVSMDIEWGSFVGVIGGNGSGKSTLLKLMSGLLYPDRGSIEVRGSMSALLELGLGFSPELTVRENVELYAAVLGYPRREAARRVDEAIDFAGLERFRDAKLKNLSTGMKARLGFATALQAESDIMLLDEILAVGDADFQIKCLNVFEDLKHKSRTIVLVSHDLGMVKRFCDSAVWLDRGRVAATGDPETVIFEYLKSVGHAPIAPESSKRGERYGDGRLRMVRAWIEDDSGRRVAHLHTGDRVTAVVQFRVREDTVEPVLGLAMQAEDGSIVYSINTNWAGKTTELMRAGQVVEMRVPFVAALRDGRYDLQVAAAPRELTGYFELVNGAVSFFVHGSPCRMGSVDLQGQIHYHLTSGEGEEDSVLPIQQRGGAR